MAAHLCIHCHFYQPPREDPWMETVFPEGSAAPFLNWNERICRECYSPLGWAKCLDGEGKIIEMLNCYEWMSFNAGPTLMSWMEKHAPRTYARILEADARSLKRLGHGNAVAQVMHHAIMPLASQADKDAEVQWGIADFEARFGRKPEGMWLAEAAVDTPTLETLAARGISFVILAPRQIKEVGKIGSDAGTPVDEGSLDTQQAYRVELPSGNSIAAFPYQGPLSQAVAFENLLSDGKKFWNRICETAREDHLLSLATDGETYGHHFTFGEMALAFVLGQARDGVNNMVADNYGSWLESHPPDKWAKIYENSSWSCVHGVERWREDCGCSTGGHPGWNQKWRKPLRDGLNRVKELLDAHFNSAGSDIFLDPAETAVRYGDVLAGLVTMDRFAADHFRPGLNAEKRETGWKLAAMKKWSLAAFASCAWFFDDIGRIEPLNAMTCILKAMDIARETGAVNMEGEFTDVIRLADSNDPELGTGLDLWNSAVLPRRETPASTTFQGILHLVGAGCEAGSDHDGTVHWPGMEAEISFKSQVDSVLTGTSCIRSKRDLSCRRFKWTWTRSDMTSLLSGTLVLSEGDSELPLETLDIAPGELPWSKIQAAAADRVRKMDEELWEFLTRKSEIGSLFLDYQEAQTCQTVQPYWDDLWPQAAWSYLFLGCSHALPVYIEYLKRNSAEHSARGMVSQRAAVALADLFTCAEPDWKHIENILAAARTIHLELDMWTLQRAFLQAENKRGASAGLRRMLGFSDSMHLER